MLHKAHRRVLQFTFFDNIAHQPVLLHVHTSGLC